MKRTGHDDALIRRALTFIRAHHGYAERDDEGRYSVGFRLRYGGTYALVQAEYEPIAESGRPLLRLGIGRPTDWRSISIEWNTTHDVR